MEAVLAVCNEQDARIEWELMRSHDRGINTEGYQNKQYMSYSNAARAATRLWSS